MLKPLLLGAALAMFTGFASADPIDPDITIDDGCCSTGISVGTIFDPINGGGQFEFENDFGATITELVLTTTLPENSIIDICSSGFFLFCDVRRDGTSVTLDFHGVNPPDIEFDPCDTEFGEQEGIPAIVPGCKVDETHPTLPGHFIINLNPFGNDGWTSQFQVSSITTTPEPSSWAGLGTGLLFVFAFGRRKALRRL